MSEQALKTEEEQKRAFAAALLRTPDDPVKAAFASIPSTGLAIQAAKLWLTDPIVVAEKIRLIETNGLKSFLATKEEQAKDIYQMATDTRIDEEVRLKAHRLYAEILGHIEKPQLLPPSLTVNTGVMLVRDHGTNEEWEQKAILQQKTLIAHATVIN